VAQRAVLLRIFCAFFVSFAVASVLFSLVSAWEFIHIALCYIPFSLAYIVLFSAIEADSPSLTMVKFVAAAGASGRSAQEFTEIINDESLLMARISAMVQDGMVHCKGDMLYITPKGVAMARFFLVVEHILNLKQGG
jgi:hypothetical protein